MSSCSARGAAFGAAGSGSAGVASFFTGGVSTFGSGGAAGAGASARTAGFSTPVLSSATGAAAAGFSRRTSGAVAAASGCFEPDGAAVTTPLDSARGGGNSPVDLVPDREAQPDISARNRTPVVCKLCISRHMVCVPDTPDPLHFNARKSERLHESAPIMAGIARRTKSPFRHLKSGRGHPIFLSFVPPEKP